MHIVTRQNNSKNANGRELFLLFPVPAVKSYFSQLLNRLHPVWQNPPRKKTSVTNAEFMAILRCIFA